MKEPVAEKSPAPEDSKKRPLWENKWVWLGGGICLILLMLISGYVWSQQQNTVSSSDLSTPVQPAKATGTMGEYIQEKWGEDRDLTSLAYGEGVWGAVFSENANLGQQTWHVTSNSPKEFIEEKWKEGFDVTNLAFGDSHWVIVLSTGANLGQQTWHFTPDSPTEHIQAKWKEGFEVSSIAHGNGGWAIIYSDNSNLGQQVFHLTADSPKTYIESKWAEGFEP